jgi:hypothetical protein
MRDLDHPVLTGAENTDKRHHVTFAWVFIEFHTTGEGPRDHEILHHVAILELVFDGVRVVWASKLPAPSYGLQLTDEGTNCPDRRYLVPSCYIGR